MFKNVFMSFLAIVIVFVLGACSSDGDGDNASADNGTSDSTTQLSFGGATPGGAAYQISTGYAEILNSNLDSVQVDVEVTGGGVDNVELISSGSIDSGTGNSGVGYQAYNGEDQFDEPLENLVAWLPVYNYPFQVVVPADSDLESISDLEGADISVNVMGSGGEVTSNEVFETLGLIRDENYTPHYLDYSEAADALSTNRIDATVFSSGAPTPQLTELMATTSVRILEFTDEEIAAVDEAFPYLTGGEIEAGTYEDIDENVQTVFAATIHYLSEDLSDDLVYDMTKTIWENKTDLESVHGSQKQLNKELIQSAVLPIMPLHPGAEKYLEEEGLLD